MFDEKLRQRRKPKWSKSVSEVTLKDNEAFNVLEWRTNQTSSKKTLLSDWTFDKKKTKSHV